MTTVGPVARPGILDIDAYVPGESKVPGGITPAKLSSNETPLGPSPKAIEAFRAAAAELERYPDGQATALRQAIARRYGLDVNRIVCGAGSDEILGLLARGFLGPGDEAIYTEHGFLVYRIAILTNGATPVVAPEKDLKTDVDTILARVTERTRVVFVANPNNPTGTYIPIEEVRRLRAGLREDILLVLDAAYAEYVSRNDYESGIELVATTSNTVMTRTFSKIHGLAALRIGWGIARPQSPMFSTGYAGRSICRRRRSPAVRLRSTMARTWNAPSSTMTCGCPGFRKSSQSSASSSRRASRTSF